MSITEIVAAEPARPGADPLSVVIRNFRRVGKNAVIAAFDLEVPSWRLIFLGCLWCRSTSGERIYFASREWVDQRDGLRRFAELARFTDRDAAQRFQAAVLTALRAFAAETPQDPI